ncbi:MAG: 1,4-alpha-glucan branching protein GlgB [Atopobiaceae bacterium]|nr:1,4-alpha-glucan branching protein GlgB [Atopobiaceae bacterium]
MDFGDFYAGAEFFAHTWLGAHPDDSGVTFRTYAPKADYVNVRTGIGDVPMGRAIDGNFWEAHVDGLGPGDPYTYLVSHDDETREHCDPYGYGMDLRPSHRSIVRDLSFEWHDEGWMATRSTCYDEPLNIYELHLGSWRKRSGVRRSTYVGDWFTYAEVAYQLIPYLKETGYTHVEFLPLTEHPFDGSWGYQPTGFFSPTSRYGTARQLMELIDMLHGSGIGAILDYVPVHFATDDYGLARYDGTSLFEPSSPDEAKSEWGSLNFAHDRGEVRSFLQSAANYWLGAYHFDGLRMDAISRVIYRNGDPNRGVNGPAVEFVRNMNGGLRYLHPSAMLIAEDSTDYPGITAPVNQGGLGFDYKWDMGWMNDTLDLFRTPPEERGANYHKLSFSMMYYPNERYLLSLSHDEVVHEKATIVQKMWGDYDLKFPQARTLALYMFAHPGKKLNFMGSELAQLREWDELREQDWSLRQYPLHDSFYRFCAELNGLHADHPALWANDYDDWGFSWRQVSDPTNVVYAFERRSARERMLCVLNLSDKEQRDYIVCLEDIHRARMLINTDWQRFSGATYEDDCRWFKLPSCQLTCTLAPFSGQLYVME